MGGWWPSAARSPRFTAKEFGASSRALRGPPLEVDVQENIEFDQAGRGTPASGCVLEGGPSEFMRALTSLVQVIFAAQEGGLSFQGVDAHAATACSSLTSWMVLLLVSYNGTGLESSIKGIEYDFSYRCMAGVCRLNLQRDGALVTVDGQLHVFLSVLVSCTHCFMPREHWSRARPAVASH